MLYIKQKRINLKEISSVFYTSENNSDIKNLSKLNKVPVMMGSLNKSKKFIEPGLGFSACNTKTTGVDCAF